MKKWPNAYGRISQSKIAMMNGEKAANRETAEWAPKAQECVETRSSK